MSLLKPEEMNFAAHFDYESCNLGEPGFPMPAHNWMTAHGVAELEIFNILALAERVNPGNIPEEPPEPFAPAWKTAEEAKQRNSELEPAVV